MQGIARANLVSRDDGDPEGLVKTTFTRHASHFHALIAFCHNESFNSKATSRRPFQRPVSKWCRAVTVKSTYYLSVTHKNLPRVTSMKDYMGG